MVGTVFRTFAPNALKVSLLLAGEEMPMQRVYDGNFYEATVPGVKAGAPYEYRIYKPSGGYTDHCDPYGFGMELRPAHKSVVVDLSAYSFADSKWLKQRTDQYALAQYDGTALYEYPHWDVGTSEWGSYNFMHSRGEVRSFLQSAANFWLKEYHFDGPRMDAISRIIYWQGDEKRGVNGNAVDFIKVMNRGLKENNPGCILIAEDSTNYSGITKAVNDGASALTTSGTWDGCTIHWNISKHPRSSGQPTIIN